MNSCASSHEISRAQISEIILQLGLLYHKYVRVYQ